MAAASSRTAVIGASTESLLSGVWVFGTRSTSPVVAASLRGARPPRTRPGWGALFCVVFGGGERLLQHHTHTQREIKKFEKARSTTAQLPPTHRMAAKKTDARYVGAASAEKGAASGVRSKRERARAKKYLEVASVVMFGGVVSTTLLSTARPKLLALLSSGKGRRGGEAAASAAASAARLLGIIGTAGALGEFVTGPAIGRLSDARGRKRYIMGGMLTTAVLDLLVSLSRPLSRCSSSTAW